MQCPLSKRPLRRHLEEGLKMAFLAFAGAPEVQGFASQAQQSRVVLERTGMWGRGHPGGVGRCKLSPVF